MNYKDFKKGLLKDPEFREEYYKFDIGLWLEEIIIKLKIWWGRINKK